jgi:hypothetical protein
VRPAAARTRRCANQHHDDTGDRERAAAWPVRAGDDLADHARALGAKQAVDFSDDASLEVLRIHEQTDGGEQKKQQLR